MIHKLIKRFFLISVTLLLLVAGIVALFDPFYHYHAPLFSMQAVLTQKEYQVIGTIRNFEYDSLIVGSSTAENNNNHWFDSAFDVTSIKAIKSSGTTAELDYYIGEAYEEQELKYIFYSLDLFALEGDPEAVFPDESMPTYLYDDNPFNDVKYLLNKDVLFEDIPYMLAEILFDDYDEGTSYNWAQYKTFSKEEALNNYDRPEVSEEVGQEEYLAVIDANVDILKEMVEAHPETEFYFFYPPYSLLWWDNMTRSGQLEESLYAAEASIEGLIGYENVKLFYFQNETEIIYDLELYMDPIHFSQDINAWMVDRMTEGEYLLTEENYAAQLSRMREIAEQIEAEYDSLTAAA